MTPSELYKKIFDELVEQVESIRKNFDTKQTDNYPTPQWISGKLQQLSQLPSIEDSVRNGTINNPEKLEDYQKFITLKNIGLKYKLIKQEVTNSGNVKYSKTDLASKFTQELQKSYKNWTDLRKQFRELGTEENTEWYNSLSNQDKNIVDIYSQLTAEQYSYLMGLIREKDKKKNYTNRIDSGEANNSTNTKSLINLGIINNDYTLNTNIITNMLEFINDKTYARLKSFNKNISYITDRISADRALMKNYISRNLDTSSNRRASLSTNADDILDSIDDNQKNTFLDYYRKNRNLLKSPYKDYFLDKKMIENNGEFTLLGKYIYKVLTSGIDLDNIRNQGEKFTQYSRLSKQDTNSDINKSSRNNEKAGTRSSSFKDFLSK